MFAKSLDFITRVDVCVAILLFMGGLNWRLVGFLGFDLMASLFGGISVFSRIIYAAIGSCAIYQIFQLKPIQRRWGCTGLPSTSKA